MSQPHVIVIGGGINGAAIARDAARRGLRVSLFERVDFGCGTSWASSKLIHGGLRYLEHLHIHLVRTSLRERNWLLSGYPSNTTWMPFLVPIYKNSPYSRWKISTGLSAYHWLDPSGRPFRRLNDDKASAFMPELDNTGLRGAFIYDDGHCHFPERLVLDNIKDAVRHGAAVFNHHEVLKVQLREGRACAVVVRNHLENTEREVPCDYLVNAAGPWIDGLVSNFTNRPLAVGVKGSHIVFSNASLKLNTAVYAPARSDGRPFFIIPWLDCLLVGTTEVRFDLDPADAAPSETEVEYLLGELKSYVPGVSWNREAVQLSFSGIRALYRKRGSNLGAMSRELKIYRHPVANIRNLTTVVGGKLTTFRETAQRVVDGIVRSQGWRADACSSWEPLTIPAPVPEAPDSLLCERSVRRLKTLHGPEWYDVAAYGAHNAALSAKLSPGVPDIGAQVVHAVQNEWARTVEDVILRRTGAFLDGEAGKRSARVVAAIMQKILGWSDTETAQQVRQYEETADRLLLSHR